MSPDLPCSRAMGASGQEERQLKCCTHHAWCLPYKPVGAVYDLGLQQVVRSRFSNAMQPKNEVSWIYWMTRLFHQHGHVPRWQCQDSSGSNCERAVQGTWDWPPQSPDLNPTENLWNATRSWWKIDATLDGNKCWKRCHRSTTYTVTFLYARHKNVQFHLEGGTTMQMSFKFPQTLNPDVSDKVPF